MTSDGREDYGTADEPGRVTEGTASAGADTGGVDAAKVVPGHSAPAPPLRPAPPLAKRLNRNALSVAAALAGVTVLTVIVVTRPRPLASAATSSPAAGQTAPPVPARPAFLDQPPKVAPIADRTGDDASSQATTQGGGSLGVGRNIDGGAIQSGQGSSARASGALPIPPSLDGPAGASSSVMPSVESGARAESPRHLAYQAALMSSVLIGGHALAVSARLLPGEKGGALSDQDEAAPAAPMPPQMPPQPIAALASAPPGLAPAAAVSPTTAGPAATSQPPATAASSSAATPVGEVLRMEPPPPQYTIQAGTVIPGLLLTGVNSDLPGEVLGQTSRDVYDSRTQRTLLVPRGSRLIGSYDNRSVGTGRLVVAWTRLILPDGRSVTLPRLAGTDPEGQVGLHDQIDHHYGRVYGAGLLTSALTAGVQLSQPQQSALYAAPSPRQVAAGALGQTMGEVSLESARRGLDVPPTLIIRPGQPFNVFFTGDLTFDAPYLTTIVAAR